MTATQLQLGTMPPIEYPHASSPGTLIRELPNSEQPQERLGRYGPGSLSTTEVLALVLSLPAMDQAAQILVEFDDLQGLANASLHELATIKGLGPAKAARLQAALELGRRAMTVVEERTSLKTPADAANLLLPEMQNLEQEHLRVILLDTKNHVLGIPTLYVGSLNTTVVRIGEIFREAVRANSAAVILAHNHPSGDPRPSPEDVTITRQIVEAGNLLDVEVLDHLIIGRQRFVSLKERGLGF